MSAADEINLNSDEDEFKSGINGVSKLERSRSELEDIFEDIPEPRELKTETAIPSSAAAPIFEPSVTSPRPQVSIIQAITSVILLLPYHLFFLNQTAEL